MIAMLLLFFGFTFGDDLAVTKHQPVPPAVETVPYAGEEQDAGGAEAAAAAETTFEPQAADPGEPDAQAADEPPKFWIGVHVVSIPEPLAAHVGKDGLMVMNIVKDSPADKAGLDRYDVVRSFNGKPIREMSDLVSAIQEVNGKAGKLEVLRGGKAETLKLSPVSRPDSAAVEYKYEDPETVQSAPMGGAFRIQRDPASGLMRVEPFGSFTPLPPQAPTAPFALPDQNWNLFLEPFFNGPDSNWVDIDDDADTGNAQIEVRVQVNNNGEKLSIQRHADGKIEVSRTDADGKIETKSYENAKAFREADPEAYGQYRRSSGGHRATIHFAPGGGNDLLLKRKQLQEEIQRQLDAVRPKQDQSQQPAQPKSSGASSGGGKRQMKALSSSVSVEDNGRVNVIVTENGKTTMHQFTSVHELREKDPQLYERVKALLEQKGAVDRRLIAAA